jgi:CDP-diacylglycerol--glycerol-3-phosphate 3-phosphatidyltransferase
VRSTELHFNTLANKLTALRIAFVPLVVLCLFEDSPRNGFLAAIFFGIAGITDYFDGYYARTQKAVTVIGKLLDPLADKFLVVSSLVMLMYLGRIHPAIVILLICREIAITGLRSIAAAEGVVIAASNLAKWKTVTQMTAIPMLMLHETYLFIPFQLLGTIFTYLSLLISIWSAKDYIVDFFKTFTKQALEKREEKKLRRIARRATRLKKMMERDPVMAEAIKEAANSSSATQKSPSK